MGGDDQGVFVQTVAEMRKRFDAGRGAKAFHSSLQLSEAGLTLGRGTVLASNDGLDEDLSTEPLERIAVLLSATYGREVPPQALRSVTRAVRRWREGDGALAHIELAFARLPRLESEDDGFRLFLAAALLDEGHTPQWLARELGFDADLLKYDPDQPRVPAGSGRASGQWGSGSPREALLGLPAARSAAGSFLTEAAPGVVQALARFAARFSVPTAVLGALFIPTPNSGGVTRGTLPDAPDIRFRRDGPAGTLRLARTLADGSERVALAQNQRGVYVDEDVAQARKQAGIARARGVGLKWYYAEQGAADAARQRFHDDGIQGIVIATMPPRRRP